MSPIINNYLIVPKKFFSRFIMPYEILPMFLFCQVGGESYVSKNILDTLLNEGTLNEKYLVISVLHIREESYINFSDISAVHFVNEFALQEFLSRSYSNLEPSMLKLEVLAKGVVDTQKKLDFIEPEGLEKESIANSLRLGDALARILFINISNEGEEFFQKINFSSTYNLTMCLFPSEFKSELEKNIAYSFFQICVKFNIDKGWPQEKVIGELIEGGINKPLITEEYNKWKKVVDRLVEGEFINVPFTDEGNIVLRAMTLVLLNPTVKSLELIKESMGNDLGVQVYRLSIIFASAREGYSFLENNERETIKHLRSQFRFYLFEIYNFLCGDYSPQLQEKNVSEEKNEDDISQLVPSVKELGDEPWLEEISLFDGSLAYGIKGVRALSGFSLYIQEDKDVLKFYIIEFTEKGQNKLTKSLLMKLLKIQAKLIAELKFLIDEQGLYLAIPKTWLYDSTLEDNLKKIFLALEPLKLKRKSR